VSTTKLFIGLKSQPFTCIESVRQEKFQSHCHTLCIQPSVLFCETLIEGWGGKGSQKAYEAAEQISSDTFLKQCKPQYTAKKRKREMFFLAMKSL